MYIAPDLLEQKGLSRGFNAPADLLPLAASRRSSMYSHRVFSSRLRIDTLSPPASTRPIKSNGGRHASSLEMGEI